MPQARDDIVDAVFAISCRSLPVDHAYALSQAIQAALPWFAAEPGAGLHTIHGAASGSGWLRPEGEHATLQLSRRSKLVLRLPRRRVDDAAAMVGGTLQVAAQPMRIDGLSVRPLSRLTTLFSRSVVLAGAADAAMDDESAFLAAVDRELDQLGIDTGRMLCGRITPVATPARSYRARSLMLAGLAPAHALALQRQGLGMERKLGCGLFIPHRSIAELR